MFRESRIFVVHISYNTLSGARIDRLFEELSDEMLCQIRQLGVLNGEDAGKRLFLLRLEDCEEGL